jgi:hypothetical protein
MPVPSSGTSGCDGPPPLLQVRAAVAAVGIEPRIQEEGVATVRAHEDRFEL